MILLYRRRSGRYGSSSSVPGNIGDFRALSKSESEFSGDAEQRSVGKHLKQWSDVCRGAATDTSKPFKPEKSFVIMIKSDSPDDVEHLFHTRWLYTGEDAMPWFMQFEVSAKPENENISMLRYESFPFQEREAQMKCTVLIDVTHLVSTTHKMKIVNMFQLQEETMWWHPHDQ